MAEIKYSAVVMAGGFGSRLAPITNSRPKPLIPVYNRSAFERILDLLAKYGFSNAAVTVMYLPEQLERITHQDVKLAFFREDEPRGSAGAVRALYASLADTVLIISGDAVCDFDLNKYFAKHISEKRKATMLLTRTKIPQEFGTVITDKNTGKIERFIEKPSWADTLSSLINTGIYILDKSVIELIPEDAFFDFGRDLFPLLMKKKIPIYGEEASGYWCDIGSFGAFYDCNMRFSNRKNIFGKNCTLNENAAVNTSILFENVTVGKSEINSSIICEGVVIGDDCVIPEGCIIGAESIIGDRAVLSKGIRIADKIKIGRGAKIMGNVFINSAARHLFGDEGINGIYGKEIDGELCFKLGQGLSILGKPCRIGVLSDGSENSDLLADIIKVGIRSSGGILLELEEGFCSLASFAPQEYNLDCCVFVSCQIFGNEEEKVNIRIYDKNGLLLSREKQRKIESALRDKHSPPKIITVPEKLDKDNRIKLRYCKYLQNTAGRLDGVSISCSGNNKQANFFFSNAKELGMQTDLLTEDNKNLQTDIFFFGKDGGICAETKEGNAISFWQLFVLAAQSIYNKDLYLPLSTPKVVETYLNNLGFTTFFYNDSDSEERKKAFATHFYSDSVLLALLVCRYLHLNKVTLEEAAAELPVFFIRSVDIDIDDDEKADTIGALADECEDCSRGVRLHNEKGSVAVFPRAQGGFRVFAEAVSAEFADDLCSFAEKKIKKQL